MDIKTVVTIIKNFHSYHLNRDLVGFHEEVLLDPVRNEEVLAFAEATKDKNPLYKELGLVPPFFFAKSAFPLIKKILSHNDLGMNMLRVVLAEQEIIWYEPLTIGNQYKLTISINDIHDTTAGQMIELGLKVRYNDRLMIESIIGFIVRAKRKAAKRKKTERIVKKEIFRFSLQTEQGQELEFAKITGDHHFIHTSNLLAKMVGLPGRVMHGACVMAMICSVLVKNQLDNDLSRLSSLNGRLAKPVVAGDQLTIIGYETWQPGEVQFHVRNSKDIVVFKDGILKYKNKSAHEIHKIYLTGK
jgi:hypothetical protein